MRNFRQFLVQVLYLHLKKSLYCSKSGIPASQKYMAPKTYKEQKKGQTLYIKDDTASIQSLSSSSIILTDRDSSV